MPEKVEIWDGDTLLARHIPAEAAWTGGLQFFSVESEFVQVGTWGYDAGRILSAHVHNEVRRENLWTQEVLYVRNGSIRADIYGLNERKIAEFIVRAGDIVILLVGGHGYEILENGTQVLEIKNGPYVGAETDRRRL